MNYTCLSLTAVSLMALLSRPAQAIEFVCTRMSESITGAEDGFPHETRVKIDLSRKVVTEILGCATMTYSNSSDPDVTGYDSSRCPPSHEADPTIRSLERLPRHNYQNETFHVDADADTVEWGSKNRTGLTLSNLDLKQKTMISDSTCLNCIAVLSRRATYQCKAISR